MILECVKPNGKRDHLKTDDSVKVFCNSVLEKKHDRL